MSLIIEDGTIVAGANAFNTDDEFLAYAKARGILPIHSGSEGDTIPATEVGRNVLQIKAMDYFFGQEFKLQGCRTSEDQELPYPRSGVCTNCRYVASDEIPKGIKNALLELSIQLAVSEILVNTSNQNVKREKLGPLETEYFSGGSWENIRTDKANAYLNPYKINGGNSNMLDRGMR